MDLHAGQTLTVFLSALEHSADRHAAALIHAIRRQRPGTRFLGLAGPEMRKAGCQPVDDLTGRSAMLLGALGIVGHAASLLRRVDRLFAAGAADIFVPVDSPTFNLPLARRAGARGLPVVYFIAPQVWAWAEFRIRKVRRRVNRLAVILPFEEEYFRHRGIDATYVGHPLVESLSQRNTDARAVNHFRHLGRPVVTCMTGSRSHVIEEVLPGQMEIARRIAEAHPEAVFLFAAANDDLAERIGRGLQGPAGRSPAFRYHVETGHNGELIQAADLVLVASGTATLEVAYYRRPMIVMYNASKWGYRLIGRRLIRTKHLSLVNILAASSLVPEFMPYYDSVEPIVRSALEILADPARQARIANGLDTLIRSLGTHPVAERTARIVLDALPSGGRRVSSRGPRGSRHQIW